MIQLPSSPSGSSKVGTISRKREKYDIHEYRDDTIHRSQLGEEIKNITCVLPKRNKKGEMRLGESVTLTLCSLAEVWNSSAPRPISRRLVVSAQEVAATPLEADPRDERRNPERFSYPKKLLKHTFMPYGSHSHRSVSSEDVEMDVDAPQPREKEKDETKKRKQRADDAPSPKQKSKKPKVGK